MKVLILRLDAPLVSFGASAVDHHGVVQRFPTLSLLTGLVANALGWDHRDADRLDGLQERIRYAARIDRSGHALVDYQTVDLGQDHMRPELCGWTTRGVVSSRGGGSSDGTHIRQMHYRADSVHSVALTLTGDEWPSVVDVADALREPARPLFIGRKCCLPASPILVDSLEASSLLGALASSPRSMRADSGTLPAAWWDGDEAEAAVGQSVVVAVCDERDWQNRVHVGRRFMREGMVDPPEAARG